MRKLDKSDINSKLESKGIQMTGEYLGSFIKTNFTCGNGHHFMAQARHVIGGTFGCHECFVNSSRISDEDINDRIVHRGIRMTGPYIDTVTKTEFECQCGYKWLAEPRGILKGRGCHKCATHGFNPFIPAWVYVLVFGTYIKYGITNNLDQRLYSHKRRNGEFHIAITKLYIDGHMAKQVEQKIKSLHCGKYVTKSQCPDGWTETLPIEKLELVLESVNNV
jgi:hypothetical protein